MNYYDSETFELYLYMEDLCCELCRFEHLAEGVLPQDIRIRQKVDLGKTGAYADASISLCGERTYFLEVNWGYDRAEIAERIAYKYESNTPALGKAHKLRVVVSDDDSELASIESTLRACVDPQLEIEVWTAPRLREMILRHFQMEVRRFEREDVLAVRSAIEKTKGKYAFGSSYDGSVAQLMLMWHMGCWTIRRVQQEANMTVESVMRKGLYRDAAVLIADLSGFSGYVRDSPDDSVVQNALESFYTKTRREVINCGGMLSQFVGDAVVGVFGVPIHFPNYVEHALECAIAIRDIGKSVSQSWQRHIDRLQTAVGCHTGLAIGDVHLVPLREFTYSHLGLVADAVDIAARLGATAQHGEIVLSNALYQRLGKASRAHFVETDPIEAKNVGRLQGWRWDTGQGQ
jgi:class 3 adenylate cyclase